MTDVFNKYIKYSYLDEDGHRWINEDAPDEIKNENAEVEEVKAETALTEEAPKKKELKEPKKPN